MSIKKMNPLYRYGILALTYLFHADILAQTVLKTMKRIPDTGVNTGYTTTPGEDADFNLFPPFFQINTNGTAIDTVTGLMWQRTDGGEMSIEKARIYCDTLTLGGFTDWRLPYLIESHSILNHSVTNPAMDIKVFPKTGAEYWWSAETQANDTNKIWVSNAGGGVGNHAKTETVSAGGTKKFHVRAVRSIINPVTIQVRFADNGNGSITDALTGLIWFKKASADSLSWENALLYADSCTAGGFSDWRLPNVKELQSLSDIKLVNPCFNKSYLQFTGRKFWTSTTLPNQTGSAWYLDNRYGITTYDPKTRKNYCFLLRGGAEPTNSSKFVSAQVRVWPNPFSDRINTNSGLPNGLVHYHLVDRAGRTVFAGDNPDEYNFSSLTAGVYFLQYTGARQGNLRLIKKATD